MPKSTLTPLVAAFAFFGLAVPALADEYDAALRCVVLIEIAKMNYTGATIDALRQAGDLAAAHSDATRPANLSEDEKLARYNAAIAVVQQSGGLSTPEGRAEAEACAASLGVALSLAPA